MTELKNLLEAKNRDELRQWLKKNHATELECWVTVKRGRPKEDETFWYVDAVEEALCFGWIDSTTKKLSDNCTIQRLTPRQKNSAWSELNKERCRRMERMGRMTDAGRDCCPDMSGDGDVRPAVRRDCGIPVPGTLAGYIDYLYYDWHIPMQKTSHYVL